jgi:uncharacterized protein with FMN-binding domain
VRRGSALGLVLASGIALTAGWRLGQESGSGSAQALATPAAPSSTATASQTAPSQTPPSQTRPSQTTAKAPTSKAGTAASSATPRSFSGAAEQTQYGTVQVRVVIKDGKLVDVVPLHLTDRGGRSVSISASAAPTLRREALAAGSARIDAVSGASYTSAGYIQSLQSALDAARAAGA